MPVIDLRHSVFKIKDGYVGPSPDTPFQVNNAPSSSFAVNNVSGYTTGATGMDVDLGTGIIPTGSRFTVAGETGSPEHKVTAHTETLSNTTHIVFTPALAGNVADDAVITLVGGYSVGTTVMAIDIGTGALKNGDLFTVGGESPETEHTITAHTENTGNTRTVTFTPALVTVVADDAVITIKPHELIINIDSGALTYAEKHSREYIKARGRLHSVRDGDEDPVEVKFGFLWEYLKSASTDLVPTPRDALVQEGPAANWVSSSADKCEPYAVDIEITRTECTDSTEPETVTFEDFRWEQIDGNVKDSTLSCSGKSNRVEPTITRG